MTFKIIKVAHCTVSSSTNDR